MPITLKEFQNTIHAGLLARLRNVAALYRQVDAADADTLARVRRGEAGVVLQAPTGAGKTAIAIATVAAFSREERVLWFWFAPFAGLVEQARNAIRDQAPDLTVLDLAGDRQLARLEGGGVFVTTWAAVAAGNAEARKARITGDNGLAVDALIALAREQGLRIGCVVDEAHHGFHRARQAQAFFRDVLQPDYALMMTATPRDADIASFERDTGYWLGDEADWASVSRAAAVDEGLLKRGVRMVRFLARDNDTQQLIDFEHLALRECTEVHRRIKAMLADQGVALTPLMLVQVPDGKDAQQAARRHLIEKLGFAEEAVRIHTSDEPDPDLIALAHDPSVEVLIFKMAVALGFDAPRAFTLAALRGARDASFGVQVIGRIVRVHALLQGRKDLPGALDYGYVFLANAESQEGLLKAGEQINAMRMQAPETGTAMAITYCGSRQAVQLVSAGQPFALMLDDSGISASDEQDRPLAPPDEPRQAWGEALDVAQTLLALGAHPTASDAETSSPVAGQAATARLAELALRAAPALHRYPRREALPAQFASERLPPAPQDIEMRLVDFVDFSDSVLACRDKTRAAVRRDETDILENRRITEGETDIWATLSPEAVAEKARQVVLRLAEINEREIRQRLLARFGEAIVRAGAVPPDDEELLEQQLDLVLVRNPGLLRAAYRRMRLGQVVEVSAAQAGALETELPLPPARKNLYGVFPAGMNGDETIVARMLDEDERVLWWHRNPPHPQRPDALGLYRWDEGEGFYPDFVVGIVDRDTPDHVALLEVKGYQLWGEPKEVEKSGAVHPQYGGCYMVGRRRGETQFHFLREIHGRLEPEGQFEIGRMRWK